ncbi:MAG: hypothetical protein PHD82_08830 [Candidatus Riflebacteria bacterium]|nr:hypothetical protein [Candidatus Riflebacteria bacterium]
MIETLLFKLLKYNRKLVTIVLILLLLFSASETPAESSPQNYTIQRLDGRLVVFFESSWALDEIVLPSVSSDLWGQNLECCAAMIETAGKQLIGSVSPQASGMRFNPTGVASDSIVITPLIVVAATTAGKEKGRIFFRGVAAEVRALENEISELAGRVSDFQRQNRCFSCHTALPMAMVYRNASAIGLNIDHEKILEIGRQISALQLGDGSFFFPLQPAYGRIMTTLCAGAIMAVISDFSSEFIFNLKKILPLLAEWRVENGPTSSDFFLRPLFIGQPTAAFFEAIIISTIYFRSFAEPEGEPDETLRLRLVELSRWADTMKSEPVHRRIVIMMGMPLLFQFSHDARPAIVRELKEILMIEPEGRRRDIRVIAQSLLSQISPEVVANIKPAGQAQSLADEIWGCLESIISARSKLQKN